MRILPNSNRLNWPVSYCLFVMSCWYAKIGLQIPICFVSYRQLKCSRQICIQRAHRMILWNIIHIWVYKFWRFFEIGFFVEKKQKRKYIRTECKFSDFKYMFWTRASFWAKSKLIGWSDAFVTWWRIQSWQQKAHCVSFAIIWAGDVYVMLMIQTLYWYRKLMATDMVLIYFSYFQLIRAKRDYLSQMSAKLTNKHFDIGPSCDFWISYFIWKF
jgi:hypothetical protein